MAISARREVLGPRRQRWIQSSTAYLAQVISVAQGTSHRNRGWRRTRVTWFRESRCPLPACLSVKGGDYLSSWGVPAPQGLESLLWWLPGMFQVVLPLALVRPPPMGERISSSDESL